MMNLQPWQQFLKWSILVLTLVSLAKTDDTKFSYEDQDIWYHEFPQCLGKQQSPINIKSSKAIVDEDLKLVFKHYDESFNDFGYYWINDGHTLKLVKQNLLDSHIITGSAVQNGHYKFKQMHLHWGDRNDFGSEHSIDGIKYPLELHLVHESIEYSYHPMNQNKLAVLAVFFVVGRENVFFRNLVHSVHELMIENKRLNILPNGDNGILDVLPNNLESYFAYNGSLTTPDCNETVRWIVFKNIQEVSEDQLNSIRSIFRFPSNSRRIQHYNGRLVFASDNNPVVKTISPLLTSSSHSRFDSINLCSLIFFFVSILTVSKILSKSIF